ncbi:MAG: hypoxanthine phosphoribosyltransferase [Actinomycetota bacterium]
MQTKVLFTADQIAVRVNQLAAEITADIDADTRPVLVGVLKGSVTFLADLVRAMHVDPDVDFMSISAYSDGFAMSGVVKIVKDLESSLEARDVIVVEDIVDTGLTLTYLLRTLQARGPRSLKVCALINKDVRRIAETPIDYQGFETEEFLVGYGLDFKGRYRNLPYLAAVDDVATLAAHPDALNDVFWG